MKIFGRYVLPLDDSSTDNYVAAMQKIAEIASYNSELMRSMATSKSLWEGLVNEYHQHFNSLSDAFKKLQLKPREGIASLDIPWNLMKSVKENIEYFASVPQTKSRILNVV